MTQSHLVVYENVFAADQNGKGNTNPGHDRVRDIVVNGPVIANVNLINALSRETNQFLR